MSVGSRIKERREALGITQVQLAEMLGVTKGAVGNYESGANSPKAALMYKLFEALKCDANYIYQDDMDAAFLFGMDAEDLDYEKRLGIDEPSPEAMDLARTYDSLGPWGKQALRTLAALEVERQESEEEERKLRT